MIMDDRFNYSKEFYQKSEAVLDLALHHTPIYGKWQEDDPGVDEDINRRFDHMPTLCKKMIRKHFPLGLMPDDRDLESGLASGAIEYTFTSGTTDEKLINIWNQDWWDRGEAASWQLNEYTAPLAHPTKMAELASSLNVGISCEEDLPTNSRIIGNKLYLNEKINIIQWQKRHYQRMAQELREYRPEVLEANPSLLARLAYWAMDHNVRLYSPKVIIFTYEFPSSIHLREIRRVFDSAFVSSFGSTETGFVLQQGADGRLYQNTKFCRIDFVPLNAKWHQTDLGRILVTTFDNPWNVIMRFDTGDLIRLSDQPVDGHEGIIATAVEGRVANLTFKTNGAIVTTKEIDDALAKVTAIRDYHLKQLSEQRYLLDVMLTDDREIVIEAIQAVLKEVYGTDGDYRIRCLKNILPGPAGKFRRTESDVNFDPRELVQ